MTNAEYVYGIPYENLPTYKVKPPVGSAPVERPEGINYELLDEIMEFIKAHPLTWRQESWYKYVSPTDGETKYYVTSEEVQDANVCGTAFCFAGHVAIHEGFPSPPTNADTWWNRMVWTVDSTGEEYSYTEEASDFAQKILGLDGGQADALFAPTNTLEDLEDIIKVLKEWPDVDGWALEEYFEEDPDTRPSVDEWIARNKKESFLAA